MKEDQNKPKELRKLLKDIELYFIIEEKIHQLQSNEERLLERLRKYIKEN